MKYHRRNVDVLVIGYGNSFRGDDAVGFDAATRVDQLAHPPSVQVIACEHLTPELAEPIAAAQLVIFIDASLRDDPGVVACHRLEPPLSWTAGYGHHLDPSVLLDCAAHCFGRAPRAYIFSVGGEFFGYRQGLSDAVARGETELLERVNALIAWWQGRIAYCRDAQREAVAHA